MVRHTSRRGNIVSLYRLKKVSVLKQDEVLLVTKRKIVLYLNGDKNTVNVKWNLINKTSF